MSVSAGFEAAQTAIAAGTYTGFGEEAVDLYRHIMSVVQQCEETVDFGGLAIDIGSRDERHRSLITALGPAEVVGIEPNKTGAARAVVWGIAKEDEIFDGDLQSWAETDPIPADTAFLFNVLRRLIESRDFMSALRSSVAVGGIAVVSFMRSDVDPDFIGGLPQFFAGFRRIDAKPSAAMRVGGIIPRQPQARNTNLSIWRRED